MRDQDDGVRLAETEVVPAPLGRVVRADTVLAAYLGVADGGLTARQALHAIAQIVERDPDEVCAQALPAVRDLVADGLLR